MESEHIPLVKLQANIKKNTETGIVSPLSNSEDKGSYHLESFQFEPHSSRRSVFKGTIRDSGIDGKYVPFLVNNFIDCNKVTILFIKCMFRFLKKQSALWRRNTGTSTTEVQI